MPREADFDIAEHGNHEDDAWFEGAMSSPAQRDKRARVLLALGLVVLLLLGIALGAFSSNTPAPTIDVERLRARAKAAGDPTPLRAGGDQALMQALDHLVAVMPPPAPPAPVADVVSAADAAGDAVAGDAAVAAAAEVDAGPTVAVAPVADAKIEKPKQPKDPTKVGEPKVAGEPKANVDPKLGIPRLDPKAVDPKMELPKVPDPKTEAKVEDPKLKGPVDAALADAKAHLDAGRWAEAKAGYEKVLTLSAGNTRALLGRGRALLELRQVQPALKDIIAVLNAEPKNPTALLLAGSISQELGQKDQARGYYQRYLDAWPSGRKAAEVKALLERL